jgi:hypothetical protein
MKILRNGGTSSFQLTFFFLHRVFPGTSDCCSELIDITETGLAIFKAAPFHDCILVQGV